MLTLIKSSAFKVTIWCESWAPVWGDMIFTTIPCDVSWLWNHSVTKSVMLSCTYRPSPLSGMLILWKTSKIILCCAPLSTFAISMSINFKFGGCSISLAIRYFLLCTKRCKVACNTALLLSWFSVKANIKCHLWRALTAATRRYKTQKKYEKIAMRTRTRFKAHLKDAKRFNLELYPVHPLIAIYFFITPCTYNREISARSSRAFSKQTFFIFITFHRGNLKFDVNYTKKIQT